MMTSCASLTGVHPNTNEIKINPELLQECSDPPKLLSGTKGEVVIYIHDIKTAYSMCKEKHKALSDIVQEITKIEN